MKRYSKIADTYHNYQNNENYQDVPGFCKVVTIDEIKRKQLCVNTR